MQQKCTFSVLGWEFEIKTQAGWGSSVASVLGLAVEPSHCVLTWLSLCVPLVFLPFYQDTSHIGLGPVHIQLLIASLKVLSSNAVSSQGTRGCDFDIQILEGHISAHNTFFAGGGEK